jgi:hypothetical protein
MASVPARDGNVVLAPHVYILGAGASIAAQRQWGGNGPTLPSMQNLIEVLSLTEAVVAAGYDPKKIGFEALYDEIASTDEHKDLRSQLEVGVAEYFASLSLPDAPTIYDYLVLSVREKDLIATFNWDPFLLQACIRNQKAISRMPEIVFLHGNVKVAVCKKDKMTGVEGHCCKKCGKELSPSKLLYPVKQKNYADDPFIKGEWSKLRSKLNEAYYLTIFGYSAPITDVEARKLLLESWGDNESKSLSQIELIDIAEEATLEKTWNDFFVRDHYSITTDALASYSFRHPRRSCDAFAAATLMNKPWYDNPFPNFTTLKELQEWVAPLVAEEDEYAKTGKSFSGNPIPPNKSAGDAR